METGFYIDNEQVDIELWKIRFQDRKADFNTVNSVCKST